VNLFTHDENVEMALIKTGGKNEVLPPVLIDTV
jgi:hypothetical protein